MSIVHKLMIEPNYRGGRGAMFRVFHDGQLVVDCTREPFLDGCRALQAIGIQGRAELWDTERPFPRMIGDIVQCAGLAVSESNTIGPRFGKWLETPLHWRKEQRSQSEGTEIPLDSEGTEIDCPALNSGHAISSTSDDNSGRDLAA